MFFFVIQRYGGIRKKGFVDIHWYHPHPAPPFCITYIYLFTQVFFPPARFITNTRKRRTKVKYLHTFQRKKIGGTRIHTHAHPQVKRINLENKLAFYIPLFLDSTLIESKPFALYPTVDEVPHSLLSKPHHTYTRAYPTSIGKSYLEKGNKINEPPSSIKIYFTSRSRASEVAAAVAEAY